MNKLFIAILASASLAFGALATGVNPVNPTQSGTSTFTGTTTLSQTIAFPFVYQSLPSVIIAPLATNNTPATLSAVTVSNFVITVTTGATTNLTVAWQANNGYPRVQVGQFVNVANTATNVAFPLPYSIAPAVVNVEGNGTNALTGAGFVTAVTTTNFTFVSVLAQTNNWGAIGIMNQPGLNTVTY